jgi:polysaccharide export outer membrane protein
MEQVMWKLRILGAALGLMLLGGCNFTQYQKPTTASMSAFDAAGSVLPEVNAGDYAAPAEAGIGPYRIVAGDVLAVQVAPREGGENFGSVASSALQVGIPARVMSDGTIRLPYALENVKVSGLTLAQAEDAITSTYYPKYLKQPPLVFTQVRDYQTEPIAVSGGVVKPGRYDQRSDRMTLLSVLADAGGIAQNGTPVVRIHRKEGKTSEAKTILLTATHGTAIGQDVLLEPGDSVEVEMIPTNTFTVIGLVNAPGRFEYQTGAQVSLIQALSFAGGINWIADPKFARVYRRDNQGNLVTADFDLSDGRTPLGAASVVLKPGDVVAVEQTARTAAMLFLAKTIQASLHIDMGMVYTIGKDVRFSGSGSGN